MLHANRLSINFELIFVYKNNQILSLHSYIHMQMSEKSHNNY